jgi:hypothetical protein
MDLDAGSLFANLFVSSIGFVLLVYGRRMGRPPHVLTGIVLLVFPYFVPGVFAVLGIALALCLLLAFAVQRGF